MTDDLTQIKGIGPALAENLRDAGYESPEDVRSATAEELVENVVGIGPSSAPVLSQEGDGQVRSPPEKFPEVRDDLLEAAEGKLNLKQVAHAGGIAKSTLFRWLDEKPEFAEDFRRRRSTAADELIERALDPNDEIDMRFAQFLLERSFEFYKTEKHEVEADNTHRIEGDGFVVEFGN